MSARIEAPRGTLDALPAASGARDLVLRTTAEVAGVYGYGAIVTPTFESTELFRRTAGLGSDVVSKEMYTFEDRGNRSLTLRPEDTVGTDRVWTGSLLRVIGAPTGEFDAEGGPVLAAAYYRHWPRGAYVTTADRARMRR